MAMNNQFISHVSSELNTLRSEGLFKKERVINTPQSSTVTLNNGQKVINLCANNYLGLSNHPDLIAEGKVG